MKGLPAARLDKFCRICLCELPMFYDGLCSHCKFPCLLALISPASVFALQWMESNSVLNAISPCAQCTCWLKATYTCPDGSSVQQRAPSATSVQRRQISTADMWRVVHSAYLSCPPLDRLHRRS